MLAKFLIIICLIIKTHSWTWKDYPSPRGTTYWKCGISDYFCDPEEMLTDQQRKEIGEVLEDIQEKTKRPNSTVPSMREGVSLLVALSNFEFDLDDGSFRYTKSTYEIGPYAGWGPADPKLLPILQKFRLRAKPGPELAHDYITLIRFLILFCLILETHSWDWDNYPSPREATYWKCGVTKPAYVCDPDGMLTDHQREVIVEIVEDFKEKTKRPNSSIPCIREGLRLVVALAKVRIGSSDIPDITDLCTTNRKWTSSDTTKCEYNVQGIELNLDGFLYCYSLRWLMSLYKDDFDKIVNAGYTFQLVFQHQ
uniref:Uncharacterized protein n=1 Tax=Meloidogyne javanica TaxID=6303 RepID=A0A915N2W1_MELJA